MIGDVLEERGNLLAKEPGAAARFQRLDVTQPADWQRVVVGIRSREGHLDGLMNNAGIFRGGLIHEIPLADYEAVIRGNQIGCFLGVQSGYVAMRDSAGGSIVNIALRGSRV